MRLFMVETVNSARLENLCLVDNRVTVSYSMQHEWHEVKQRPWGLGWLNFFIAPDYSKGSSSMQGMSSLDVALNNITPKVHALTFEATKQLFADVDKLRRDVVILGKTSLTEKCWTAVRYLFRCGPSEKVTLLADADQKLIRLKDGLLQHAEQCVQASPELQLAQHNAMMHAMVQGDLWIDLLLREGEKASAVI